MTGNPSKSDAAAKKPIRGRRKKTVEPASRGLTAVQVGQGSPPAPVQKLAEAIERDGGGVYQPVLKRAERVERIFELDDLVVTAVAKLKERGLESAYLKNFVVARINPLRFQRTAQAEFEETITKMIAAARRFDVSKIKADQIAQAGGAPEE